MYLHFIFYAILLFWPLEDELKQSESIFTESPRIVKNPLSSAPLTCYIDFETKQDLKEIVLSINNAEYTFKYTSKEKKEYGYPVYFLHPDRKNYIELRITDTSGKIIAHEKELTFIPSALPTDPMEFPKIEITQSASESDSELILFNPRRRLSRNVENEKELNQSFGMLAITNKRGNVLWYYRTDSRISDFDQLPNGNISYMTQDSRIVEIDLMGKIINQWYAASRPEGKDSSAISVDALMFHHDVQLLPNGNRMVLSSEIREIEDYYTSDYDKSAPRKTQKVMGDIVLEFTPKGEIVHSWRTFDHLPVERIGYETFSGYWERRGFEGVIDWSHANAIVPLPEENAFLVNFRYQSAMIKVDKQNNKIKWIFAEPSGWGDDLKDKLIQIKDGETPWHQHSPSFAENGNLLFFNNNNYQARPFEKPVPINEITSYIVEYRLDEKNKTAKQVWSSEINEEKPVVSIAMGSVLEMKSESKILAGFGALVSPEHINEMDWKTRAQFPQWTMVREYAHKDPPEILWQMELKSLEKDSNVGWTIFGAKKFVR